MSVEINNTYQISFTAYDDGSVAYALLDDEASVFWQNEEYIVKQSTNPFVSGFSTKQIVATHAYNEVVRIRQRSVKKGTLTYSVQDVLDFYLKNNDLGFTYKVIGSFDKQQITDLGNGSGKDCLSKITDTWPTAVIFPKGRLIQVFSSDAFKQDLGNRIDYLHDTSEVTLEKDSTSLANQVMAYGKQKDDESYYFTPFLVTDSDSVTKWGLHPGEDISDDRFTSAASMKTYALTQLVTEPALTITVTTEINEQPVLGEVRRLEVRPTGYVTNVEIVSYTWYPLDPTQKTSITLNNTAKTILDIQNTNSANLKKAVATQKNVTSVSTVANVAYGSRVYGRVVD